MGEDGWGGLILSKGEGPEYKTKNSVGTEGWERTEKKDGRRPSHRTVQNF